jgi:hypothetical protein
MLLRSLAFRGSVRKTVDVAPAIAVAFGLASIEYHKRKNNRQADLITHVPLSAWVADGRGSALAAGDLPVVVTIGLTNQAN